MDPLTLALIQGGAGLAQTIGGAIQAAKGRKELQREIAAMPKYQQSKGILDYYGQASQRFGVSPTESAMYKRQMRNIERGLSSGVASLQDRRSALAGIPKTTRAAADAALDAEVAAEAERSRRFGQLGQAAQMKRAEEMAAFQQNLVAPSQLRMQLASQRAAGGSQIANVGMSNIFNALQSYGTSQLYKDMYGGGMGSRYPKGYKQGVNTGMLDLFQTPSTSLGKVSGSSGLTPRATPSATIRRSYVPNIPSRNTYPGSIYPFPTYPY